MKAYLVSFSLLALAACSSGSNATPTEPSLDAGGTIPTSTGAAGTTADAGSATDWQSVYALYFAPNTDGHCANCHGTGRGGFTSGTTADSMYQSMISYGLINPDDPTKSPIGVANASVLSWYNVPEDGNTTLDGRMPDDDAVANTKAAAAVTAWVSAGAKNHGMAPSGTTVGPMGDDDSGDDDDDGGSVAADAGGDDDSTDSGTPSVDAGAKDSGAKDAGEPDAGPETFTALYTTWIGPGTPGHCGNGGCHEDSASGGSKDLICGKTKAACYSGLISAGLVSTSSPATSRLGNPTTSPLSWYGNGGKMPDDNRETSAAAAEAVTSWLNAGALNN